MEIKGLDYNTKRKKLVLPEYGREVQRMVDHAVSLESREERQACAESIIGIMERMFPQSKESVDYKCKLWNHLAIMSDFKLDIDYPYDISGARNISVKPEPLAYPMNDIPARHYGNLMFEVFDKLREMPAGEDRDALAMIAAKQMKRNIQQWSHGSNDDEKIASDMARYTGGAVQLDTDNISAGCNDAADRRRKKK